VCTDCVRQQEISISLIIGYPIYGGGNGLWGRDFTQDGLMSATAKENPSTNAVAAKIFNSPK